MSPAILVREARREAKLTQTELAERLGSTQSAVSVLERDGSNPTLATLERALEAAGYDLELRAIPRVAPSVDETQILERLRLTPAERLVAFNASRRNLTALLAKARKRDADR